LRQTEADYRKAIEYYSQAKQLDPRYALAWSGSSLTWAWLSAGFLAGAPAQQAYANAHEAAEHAVALAPELAAAHVAPGYPTSTGAARKRSFAARWSWRRMAAR
jgi:serine/threonine-protein kinase